MTASKLALRNVHTPDRPVQEVQAVVRDVTRSVNGARRFMDFGEYANGDAWGTTLTATVSASYVDTDEAVRIDAEAGDVLEISGRVVAAVNAGETGAYQIAVYEGANPTATQKKDTYVESTSTSSQVFPVNCLHTVSQAGTCKVAAQMLSRTGGTAYLMARGELLVKVWRGGT